MQYYQVRFFNLTLSAGVVSVCVPVCLFVTTGPFFLEASAVVFMWPKNDIFALSAGAFFPEATYRHIFGNKW